LFAYYQRVLGMLRHVGDHLAKHGMNGLHDEFPWLHVVNHNCTDEAGSTSVADGESALRVVTKPGRRPIVFPVHWARLVAAMEYSMISYGNSRYWATINASSFNLHGLAIPWPIIYIDKDAFYGPEDMALAILIHEPLHDLSQYGPGHDGIREIVPCVDGAKSPYGSDWEQFVDFLKNAKGCPAKLSLWQQILRAAGPRPK
jgi:hypothetical protein